MERVDDPDALLRIPLGLFRRTPRLPEPAGMSILIDFQDQFCNICAKYGL
jgi:hypothetical protein